MKGNAIDWFEIYVQEIKRAKRFYESVFRITLERLESPEIEMWDSPRTWRNTTPPVHW